MLPSLAGTRLPQHDALASDVGSDLQRPAECPHVGGEGADFSGARLGALNCGNSLLADVHALGDLRLRQPEPLAGLREGVGTIAGDQLGCSDLDLRCLTREELVKERLRVIGNESFRGSRSRQRPGLSRCQAGCRTGITCWYASGELPGSATRASQDRRVPRVHHEQQTDLHAIGSTRPQLPHARRRRDAVPIRYRRIG